MQIIRFQILQGADGSLRASGNLRLFLVLEGELCIQCAGQESRLHADDLRLINRKTSYTLRGDTARYVLFEIDDRAFRALFPHKRYHFRCDSTQEINENYGLLRGLLRELLLICYEAREYQQAEIQQKTCEILIFLVNNFAQTSVEAEEGSRADRIIEYIDQHYQDTLSLQEISARFHMTPQYFSKYFRQQVGSTYYKYLNGVRMEHAVEAMLTTDESLIRIALDNGFPNAEAFHRCFKAAFEMTPQNYRRRYQKESNARQARQTLALGEAVRSLRADRPEPGERDATLTVDAGAGQPFTPHWSEAVNLGSLTQLDDQSVLEQLAQLQRELKFSYVRFMLDSRCYTGGEPYTFYWEERQFEYLLKLGLQLWITLDLRQIGDIGRMCGYLDRMLAYFANRYSISNVRKWRLELTYNTLYEEEKCRLYWQYYNRLQAVMDRFGMESPVLGAGISLGNVEGLRCFYEYMERHHLSLPGQTFEAEPYSYTTGQNGTELMRATDSSYIRNQLLSLWKHSPYAAADVQRVYLTSWTDTVLKTNPLHDACYQGAYVLKNLIQSFGEVQMLGYRLPLDVMDPAVTGKQELFGGSGLLTKHALRKPSFYAYSFLSRAGACYLAKSERAIVFSNGDANYQILCHNCKRLNYKYYLDEEHLREQELDEYFTDLDPLTLHVRLEHLPNGRYLIKRRAVGPSAGSVRDLMTEMSGGQDVYIHPNDLDYLRQVAVPRVTLQPVTVTDGTMDVAIPLEANEFAYLHIIYQY